MNLEYAMETITGGRPLRVGMFLAFGLIWTSAAQGDGSQFAGAAHCAAGDGLDVPGLSIANSYSDDVSALNPTSGGCNVNGIPDASDFDKSTISGFLT